MSDIVEPATGEVSPHEAIAAVDAAIETAHNEAAENTAAIVESVIEQATQEIDRANETAQQIAEAAMQTDIMRRVSDHEERTWRDLEALRSQLNQISEQVTVLTAALVNPISSSSTPPNSEEPPLVEEVTVEIQPDQLTPPSGEEENPAPPVPSKKRPTWI